jgi:predicted DCC family thiol-disulfide oxidoreductase YuxK
MKLLLIYDDGCAYCRGFAHLVRALDRRRRFALLPYESEHAQRLLRAQFGEDFGFAMFLFAEDTVSWGREAAQRIARELRVPGARLAFWLYPALVSTISRLTRRERPVCGPHCALPHGTAPLTPQSRSLVLSL